MVSSHSSLIAKELEGFSNDSRVWIWQAEEALSADQVLFVTNQLTLFIPQWTSHNQRLQARSLVIESRFIIVCLDQERSSSASGCSIDSLTHAIQGISNDIKIDFFNRNVCYVLHEGEIAKYALDQLSARVESGELLRSSMVFDPLINTKSGMVTEWPKTLEESWHRRFL